MNFKRRQYISFLLTNVLFSGAIFVVFLLGPKTLGVSQAIQLILIITLMISHLIITSAITKFSSNKINNSVVYIRELVNKLKTNSLSPTDDKDIKINEELNLLSTEIVNLATDLSSKETKRQEELNVLKQQNVALSQELEIEKQATLRVLQEVEQQKQISEQAAQDLKKFQLAVEQASDHIVITNEEGMVLFVNPAFLNDTKFTYSEVMGTKAGKLWGDQMSREFYQNMWQTIHTNKQPFKTEINNKKKDGSQYIAEVNISPILDAQNNVKFFVSLQRDITKAKEIDRMKTEFISLASHQLRAPLAAIKWGLEDVLSQRMGQLNEKQEEYITDAHKSSDRMVKLVNGLLNISRIESGRLIISPEFIDIKELVDGVLADVRIRAEQKQQVINVSIDQNLGNVNVDVGLIRNVLLNFMTNAIKYTPEQGQITVTIIRENDLFSAHVKDTGYGIPLEDQDRIFKKFFRASNIQSKVTEGTGLGLYLVKSIIEASAGEVWFESKEGEGSTFSFKLPIAGVAEKKGEVRLEEVTTLF